MTAIEKILTEIEHLKEEVGIGLSEYDMGYENGRGDAYNKILAFLDTLQEQEPIDLKMLIEDASRVAKRIADTNSFYNSLPENLRKYTIETWREILATISKYKKQEYPIDANKTMGQEPKGLDEAAEKYGRDIFINDCMVNGECDEHDLSDAFKAGAEWMVGQTEKDLALTLEDIERLHTFLYAVKNNKHGCFTFTRLSDEQYQEVLRRFNESKK